MRFDSKREEAARLASTRAADCNCYPKIGRHVS
jgi:hypothetical protein